MPLKWIWAPGATTLQCDLERLNPLLLQVLVTKQAITKSTNNSKPIQIPKTSILGKLWPQKIILANFARGRQGRQKKNPTYFA